MRLTRLSASETVVEPAGRPVGREVPKGWVALRTGTRGRSRRAPLQGIPVSWSIMSPAGRGGPENWNRGFAMTPTEGGRPSAGAEELVVPMRASTMIKPTVQRVAGLLGPCGFRKSANRFNRRVADDGLVHVIALQLASHRGFEPPGSLGLMPAYYGTYTLNIGVYIPELARTPPSQGGWVADYQCTIRERIGTLLPGRQDTWWPVGSVDAADVVLDALSTRVLPWLDRLASVEAILRIHGSPWRCSVPSGPSGRASCTRPAATRSRRIARSPTSSSTLRWTPPRCGAARGGCASGGCPNGSRCSTQPQPTGEFLDRRRSPPRSRPRRCPPVARLPLDLMRPVQPAVGASLPSSALLRGDSTIVGRAGVWPDSVQVLGGRISSRLPTSVIGVAL